MKQIITFSLVALMLSGCASILSKSQYPLSITTNPTGASITVKNENGAEIYTGTSPATITLDASAGFFKKASYSVMVTKTGYQSQTLPVTFKLDGWYWGNLLLGGVIGMLIIDPATGAMYKIRSEYMSFTLAQATADAKANPELQILDINSIPEGWKSKLEKVEQ